MFLPRTIATAVDSVARQVIGKDWNLYAALLSHWREIVGEDYAQVTTPVKISFPKGKTSEEKWAQGRQTEGVLHIRLPQGLVMEFSFLTDQIRQRIAAYFGYDAIARLAFEPYYSADTPVATTPSPVADPALQAQIKKSAEGIENDELRAAMEELGESILKAPKTP
jgi:hypothetical protein